MGRSLPQASTDKQGVLILDAPGAAVHVTRLDRGFLLDADYRPGPGLLNWTGDVELTAANPSAVVWIR